ncbi:hypothetical protein PoB_003951100 [Plakobranchus ocellatus]|uniref:Uncharacterized protein n=1 Tax=Plakobranchus ocellatus TaxID=259542 RepID=A0AAV4B2D5_9GAST|nr:hypothetical protein PoB_003951100 [Plakobranchus ocellatus]
MILIGAGKETVTTREVGGEGRERLVQFCRESVGNAMYACLGVSAAADTSSNLNKSYNTPRHAAVQKCNRQDNQTVRIPFVVTYNSSDTFQFYTPLKAISLMSIAAYC